MLLAVLLFVGAGGVPRAARYAAVFAAGVFVFYVLPFLALGWDATPFRAANAQFSMIGAMSFTAVANLWTDVLVLERHWGFLGLLWCPRCSWRRCWHAAGRASPPASWPSAWR